MRTCAGELSASGLATVTVPPRTAAGSTPDSLAVTVVREELAGVIAHLDSLFAMQGIGSYAMSIGGSEEVRKRWLPAIGALDAIAALALTEPDVGSDLGRSPPRVVQDGDELVVTGTSASSPTPGTPATTGAGQEGRRLHHGRWCW